MDEQIKETLNKHIGDRRLSAQKLQEIVGISRKRLNCILSAKMNKSYGYVKRMSHEDIFRECIKYNIEYGIGY